MQCWIMCHVTVGGNISFLNISIERSLTNEHITLRNVMPDCILVSICIAMFFSIYILKRVTLHMSKAMGTVF